MSFVAALVLFGLAAYCASKLYDGFRAGEMQIFDQGIVPILFFRKVDPILFWIAAAFNGAITAGLTGGGLVLVIQGLRK